MKLSDIFKLDLNTGGGNKLFARIMNKYNVPKKEYENVKQEMNSSSGGGIKMEYYKLNKEKYDDEEGSPLYILFAIAFYYPSIVKLNDRNIIKLCAPIGVLMSNETKLPNVINLWEGIAFDSNIKTSIYYPEYIDYNCNNLSELIKYLETLKGISWKDDALIPITKEEFYNLD